MAPLVPPPPILTLEEAKNVERRVLGNELPQGSTRKLNRERSRSILSFILGTKGPSHSFTGRDFVDWAVATSISPDPEHAIQVGQALLDHRLAHHVDDDFEFENSGEEYCFISQETVENRMFHSALQTYLDQPSIFHQGMLELKGKTFFGAEKWTRTYAVLDDASCKPRMLHLFKRFSAASPPVYSFAVEDCLCGLSECLDCKTDWYCFNLRAKKTRGNQKEVDLTLCANHSKRQEGWLTALIEAGVELEKEEEGDVSKVSSLFELSARRLNSETLVKLSDYQGSVCLVVNVASKCGLTPRDYTEMVALYDQLHSRGFEILAFPCNQFGSQEKGDEATIAEFVQGFGVKFPMFEKVEVNGPGAHPVFRFLKAKLGGVLGSSVKWNFTKWLVDQNGVPVKRYGPPTAPSAIQKDIEELLNKA